MKKEDLLNHLKAFDPEVYTFLQDESHRRRYALSLIPTESAMSPLAAFIEGSALANSTLEMYGATHTSSIEELVRTRAQELFGSEHAIVRLGGRRLTRGTARSAAAGGYRSLVQPAQARALCGAEFPL